MPYILLTVSAIVVLLAFICWIVWELKNAPTFIEDFSLLCTECIDSEDDGNDLKCKKDGSIEDKENA